ncbi:MAG: rod shape-determining protein MreC [SAR324 cluster bacterium]|nr:rod shape-determining protein MreC [SAR324 cluster bacterium]MCZ6558073.1 rod shape-determining protein MreC [SAR324 cluster bacterium]MCZ6841575.1 rod shape-determining protein MreC [SAR324 cluster bacterium]
MIELIRRNRLLFTAVGVLILLIVVLSVYGARPTRSRIVDETVNAVAYPFQAGFTKTASWLSGIFDRYVFLVHLKAENEQLNLENQALKEELNHYINGAIQFDMLREQLKFKEADPEVRVYAEVVGESLDNFHHALLINKGHLAGIRRNFPVVLREGVVGRVQSVTALQSVVQLIVDRRHRFPVILQRSRERMILEGGGGSLRLKAPDRGIVLGQGTSLRMERIRMLADVKQGDRVITSGLAGIFPKGLLVGIVTGVAREQHELFQTATIQPVVAFNKIEGVYVILVDKNDSGQPFFSNP